MPENRLRLAIDTSDQPAETSASPPTDVDSIRCAAEMLIAYQRGAARPHPDLIPERDHASVESALHALKLALIAARSPEPEMFYWYAAEARRVLSALEKRATAPKRPVRV